MIIKGVSSMFRKIKKKFSQLLIDKLLTEEGAKIKNYDWEFDKLQNRFFEKHEYGYDDFSTWKRAADRVYNILNHTGLQTPGMTLLDAACGDGMLGVLLNSYGHNAYLTDIEDWRNNRAKHLPFIKQSMEDLNLFHTEQFDCVCSFNAFEHVKDPSIAFQELFRVCKPGGYIYLEFGPLYCSPWGLHVHHTLSMPYPQFLFSESFLMWKLEKIGIYDLGKESPEIQPLNKWNYSQFNSLWSENPSCRVIYNHRIRNENYTKYIFKYHKAFTNRGLTYQDLTTQGICVCLQKV